jgi:hypothetical protein
MPNASLFVQELVSTDSEQWRVSQSARHTTQVILLEEDTPQLRQ